MPGSGTRPGHATLAERPWRRPPAGNRKQNGPLAGDRRQALNKQTTNRGMVQSWVTLGRGNFCRKSLFLIELLPNPIGQSVTLLSGRLNHAMVRTVATI